MLVHNPHHDPYLEPLHFHLKYQYYRAKFIKLLNSTEWQNICCWICTLLNTKFFWTEYAQECLLHIHIFGSLVKLSDCMDAATLYCGACAHTWNSGCHFLSSGLHCVHVWHMPLPISIFLYIKFIECHRLINKHLSFTLQTQI